MLSRKRNTSLLALSVLALLPAPCVRADEPATQLSTLPMEKYVSQDAIFVLYKPKGWVVTEGQQPGFRTVSVTHPTGGGEAALFLGTSPTGEDVVALTKRFLGGIGQSFPDLQIVGASVSRDRHRVAVSASFTHPTVGKRDFRCWVSGRGSEFMFESIETPAGALDRTRPLLLTILANVRVFKGAFAAPSTAPVELPRLVPHQLSDGSASFRMPQGWGCKELGKGCFIAGDSTAHQLFMVANVDVITPRLGVTVPGVPVAPYQSPSRAMQTLTAWQGAASNMRFETVIPRKDVAEQMAQVYTAGPVTVEEFVYTCDTQAGKTKGYTFGFTFGSRTDTNWSFRHLTVMAPADEFNESLPTFEAVLKSYEISDEWARNYVQQGMARLRQLQQQTSALVARNAREIHDMMQAAYDERQRSQDYIDYQRTSYIRGEQDWVSGLEGGTVYHTDSWGTRNTTTGETWEGKPYDYVNFDGRSPKHNEDMTPIDSRALWERHVAR
jgi:hypothetical protein